MEQIINILSGHNDTNAILEQMESLISAAEAVFSSDSSDSSSSSSSYESSDEDDKNNSITNASSSLVEQELPIPDLVNNSFSQLQQQIDIKPLIIVPPLFESSLDHEESSPKRLRIENAEEHLEQDQSLLKPLKEQNKVRNVEESVDFMKVIDKYTTEEFKANMRVNPSTVQFLIDGFSSSAYMPSASNGGRQCVNGKKSVFMFLWYIGNSITFTQLGTLFHQCKSTAWITVKRVSSWLISIGQEHIKWPKGPDQVSKVQRKFQNMHTIPGVIGVLGCTRIIIRPPPNDKDSYLDKHQNCSLALQAVVDAENKFLDISCTESGSLHDYMVLKKSGIFLQASSNDEELFPNDSFLLANSSYPASRWLVTPFKKYGFLSDSQIRFNYLHCTARNVINDTFRHLKTRFRKLQKFTDVNNISTLTNLINSACVLHNICIELNDAYEFGQDDEEYNNQYEIESEVYNNEFLEDSNRRDILFGHLYQKNRI